LNTSFDFSSK